MPLARPIRSSGVIGVGLAPDASCRRGLSSRSQNIFGGRWRLTGLGGFGAHRPVRHGPAGWNQRAMPANNSAAGCEAANAMRTRVAVSMTRAATLISRSRRVVNSARARGCGLTEYDTAQGQHVGQVAQAQLVAQTAEHHERDDVGGILR